ncbi:MAG TPA: hypothetical protein P5256_18730, partial [Beijerinckiaceae bacterium]|nr:hypothetical protein [Beijerinckiaceae bacterium]
MSNLLFLNAHMSGKFSQHDGDAAKMSSQNGSAKMPESPEEQGSTGIVLPPPKGQLGGKSKNLKATAKTKAFFHLKPAPSYPTPGPE